MVCLQGERAQYTVVENKKIYKYKSSRVEERHVWFGLRARELDMVESKKYTVKVQLAGGQVFGRRTRTNTQRKRGEGTKCFCCKESSQD